MHDSLVLACTPDKLTEQTSPVRFCSAWLATLAGQHIGIRESAKIVGSGPGAEAIYRDKDS